MEWISVKTKLPVNEKPVLVFTDKIRTTKRYSRYQHQYDRIKIDHYCPNSELGASWYSVERITHWMPLPEPPKPLID